MKQPELTDALANALNRIEAGDSSDAILSEQPALAADLAPLMATASAVATLPAAGPRPAFRTAVAQDLARIEAGLLAERVAGPRHPGLPVWRLIAAAVVLGGLGLWVSRISDQTARQPTGQVAAAILPASTDKPAAAPEPTQVARRMPPRVVAISQSVMALPPAAAEARLAPSRITRGLTLPSSSGPAVQASVEPLLVATELASTPVPATIQPVHNDDSPEPPTAKSTASDTPTATPADTASPPPSVTLGGMVRLGALPLEGISVGLFFVPEDSDCPVTDAPIATATTDASGAFSLTGPSELRVALAAWGGPHCLPRRWHTGESADAEGDSCDTAVQKFMLPAGANSISLNVKFADDTPVGCPH